MPSPYKIHIVQDGYSKCDSSGMEANCTCTLITGPTNIIVDTMTAWDKELLLKGMSTELYFHNIPAFSPLILFSGLSKHSIIPDNIKLLVSTHGHSDHIGNNNLFLEAKHVVGFSVSFRNKYFDHSFLYGEYLSYNLWPEIHPICLKLTPFSGEELIIDEFVKVIATPGHTLSDVSVIVKTEDLGLVAVTGMLFDCSVMKYISRFLKIQYFKNCS